MRRNGIGLAVLALSCALPVGAAAAPCSGDPAAALEAIIAADNRGDLDAVMRFYTADPVWVRPGGAPLRGAAAIRASYTDMYRDFAPALTMTMDGNVQGDGVAVVRGRTGGSLAPRAGGEPRRVNDLFEAVILCDRGRWRVSLLSWRPAGDQTRP